MKNSFDWSNPLHWVILFTVCAVYTIFNKPINMALGGVGTAMKGLGTVPIMVLGGGARMLTAPELGTYSVPGNIGGPLPEAMSIDDLPKRND